MTSILANEEVITARNDHFITLSADCSAWQDNQTIFVTLHTSEPFFGSLYSRDHASTCKSVGNGSVKTKLVISPDLECGGETMGQRDGKFVNSEDRSNQVSSN